MKHLRVFTWLFSMTISGLAMAGEFGNQCAMGMATEATVPTTCQVNAMLHGKTYCFSSEASKSSFMQNPEENLKKAEAFYAKQAEPTREKISQAEAEQQIHSAHCDLSNKDAGYLALDGMDLRHCIMVNTSFFGAYLRGANLSGANLEHAYLNLARLENADLSGANLANATIFQAIFDKTNFKGANLTNARMIGTLGNVDMSNANIVKGQFGLDIGNQPMGAMRFDAVGGNFSSSNFEGADINRSNFRFADFRGANLRHTDLFRADLSKADLTDADITGANLNEAILDGTVMTGVKGIEAIQGYDQAKGACVDCKLAVKQAASTISPSPSSSEPQMAAVCPMHQAQRAMH